MLYVCVLNSENVIQAPAYEYYSSPYKQGLKIADNIMCATLLPTIIILLQEYFMESYTIEKWKN